MASARGERPRRGVANASWLWDGVRTSLLTPIRAFRMAYAPLLMIYFAFGALGLVAIAQSFWIKGSLTFSPAQLAELNVWLTLPWAVKMVFGEMVDTIAIAGSRRRIYAFLGAGLIAASLLLLAGAASDTLTFASRETLFVAASLVSVTGIVLQDVVADAMSTEVVARFDETGAPRPESEIAADLAMVQVLGRLAASAGVFVVAGLSGLLAQTLPYATVFLIGLIVPALSISGALLVRLETSEHRATDWRILGGGLAFGALVAMLGLSSVPWRQELILLVSLGVIVAMLVHVTADLPDATRQRIAWTALLIFLVRATPNVGEGYRWFAIDVLGFDEGFFGVLAQIGAAIGLAAAWLLSDILTRRSVTQVLLWLTLLTGVMSIPTLVLVNGGHVWTAAHLALDARGIAIIDTAAQSPLVQISVIPLLVLIAVNAPAGKRAIWFALMASFMNLALVTGELATKGLNAVFPVARGDYANLPDLVLAVAAIGLVLPLVAIMSIAPRLKSNAI